MRPIPVVTVLVVAGALAAGCVSSPPGNDVPPWKVGASGEVTTAAPDAGGLLSVRNCPALTEAIAAVPVLTTGPDANAVPHKTMVLQCSYSMPEQDVRGRQAGILISVFDASAEGVHLWDADRTDPAFPNATDLPALAEVAFTTGTTGHNDVWVVEGRYGFHISHTRQGEIPVDHLVALARAMLAGLKRAPR
jgi:hypothetical protein